jgi:hypothetical protein
MRILIATVVFAVAFTQLQKHGIIEPVDPSICLAGGFLALLGFVGLYGVRTS